MAVFGRNGEVRGRGEEGLSGGGRWLAEVVGAREERVRRLPGAGEGPKNVAWTTYSHRAVYLPSLRPPAQAHEGGIRGAPDEVAEIGQAPVKYPPP